MAELNIDGKFVESDGRYVWVPNDSSKAKRPIVDDELIDWVIREEGFLTAPRDIGDGKMTIGSGLTDPKWHTLYRKRGNKWSEEDNRKAVREELITS